MHVAITPAKVAYPVVLLTDSTPGQDSALLPHLWGSPPFPRCCPGLETGSSGDVLPDHNSSTQTAERQQHKNTAGVALPAAWQHLRRFGSSLKDRALAQCLGQFVQVSGFLSGLDHPTSQADSGEQFVRSDAVTAQGLPVGCSISKALPP